MGSNRFVVPTDDGDDDAMLLLTGHDTPRVDIPRDRDRGVVHKYIRIEYMGKLCQGRAGWLVGWLVVLKSV